MLLCLVSRVFMLDSFSVVFLFHVVFTLYSDVCVCDETDAVGPLVVCRTSGAGVVYRFGINGLNEVWNKVAPQHLLYGHGPCGMRWSGV